MATGKTTILTLGTFVGKVMSTPFNMLSRVSYSFSFMEQASLNFMTAVTVCSNFGVQENKIHHCFHFSLSICHEVMGPDAMISSFLNVEF